MEAEITQVCYKCFGTGVFMQTAEDGETPIDPCPVCNGEGKLTAYVANLKSLKKRLDDIEEKLDSILSKLNE